MESQPTSDDIVFQHSLSAIDQAATVLAATTPRLLMAMNDHRTREEDGMKDVTLDQFQSKFCCFSFLLANTSSCF